MVDKSNKIFKLITSRLRVNFTQRTNVQFHISNANSGSSYYLWQNFNDMQTQILEHRQIQQKIVRIAYEIIEELAEIEEKKNPISNAFVATLALIIFLISYS